MKAVEQFLNRNHLGGGAPVRFLLSIPIFGSRTQVLWHSGHLDGLVSFSPENSKPHARQRAGSTTALCSVVLSLRKILFRSSATRLGDSSTTRAIWRTVIGLPC